MNHHLTYRPQTAQTPADSFRGGPCDTRDPRRSMNPLTGIWLASRTAPCYRDASPNGERHHPAAIVHCSLFIVHCPWSYTFSAKERDSETGLSYFGSRYYSSDLSIWLSVDPMAGKYPSVSPYVYCADNPVRLVDPNGDTLLPSAAFQASPYYMVYQNLNQTNSVYKRSVNQYQGANNNLYFDYKTEATEKAGHTHWIHRAKGTDVTVTAKTTYYRPFGEDQTEIAMAKTLLHEAVHAEDGLSKRKTPSHDGFDQASVLAGLIEYNSTYNLGYSNEDLEILSWSGLQESIEYYDYIERRALKNNRTFDEEKRFVDNRIFDIIVGNDLEK